MFTWTGWTRFTSVNNDAYLLLARLMTFIFNFAYLQGPCYMPATPVCAMNHTNPISLKPIPSQLDFWKIKIDSWMSPSISSRDFKENKVAKTKSFKAWMIMKTPTRWSRARPSEGRGRKHSWERREVAHFCTFCRRPEGDDRLTFLFDFYFSYFGLWRNAGQSTVQ